MARRRWVVVGAGAIGGTIGGRLHQGGADVVLVARGEHGAALRKRGLLLRDPDTEVVLDIASVERPGDLTWRDGDVVVLATKTQDAPAALDAVAAVSPTTPVVCATNGVAAERMALRRFAAVHGMCVMLPAAHLEPGVVEASSAPCSGILDLGLASGGHDDVDVDLAAALEAGAFVAAPDDAILRRKRAKLLMNLSNVIDAACGRQLGIEGLSATAAAEGVACFGAAGLEFASEEEDQARRGDHIRMRPINGQRRGGGSTWQSLARGIGSTEADYLNGEIVLLGRLHGVPTPINLGLQQLARRLVADHVPPGSMTAAEVDAEVRGGIS
jgi:2-dehydropantoate 2-reductase